MVGRSLQFVVFFLSRTAPPRAGPWRVLVDVLADAGADGATMNNQEDERASKRERQREKETERKREKQTRLSDAGHGGDDDLKNTAGEEWSRAQQ